METISIVLHRNHTQQDWSVEIDGTQHNHVSSATLDDLIDYALAAAQQNLLEPEDNTNSDDTDPTSVPV
jgi:hypothetical protein